MWPIEIMPKPFCVGSDAIRIGVLEQLGSEVAPRRNLGLCKVPVMQHLPTQDCGRLLKLKEIDTGGPVGSVEQAYRAEHLSSRGSDGHPSVTVEYSDSMRGIVRKWSLGLRIVGVASFVNAACHDDTAGRILDDHRHACVLLQDSCDAVGTMTVAGRGDELAEQRRDLLDCRQMQEIRQRLLSPRVGVFHERYRSGCCCALGRGSFCCAEILRVGHR